MRAVAECRLLGPVELTVRGATAPPELLWRKHLAVLVVLARAPGHRRTRDQLMTLLWGDRPERAARRSLNEALYVLRRHLGTDAVLTRGEDVQLADGTVELDVSELDRRIESGDSAAAAQLVRGEFMDGFAVPDAWDFEEWLAAERRLWHERAVTTLADAAMYALDSGHPARGRLFAERALRLDPLSEKIVRLVMLAHALTGDRAAALHEFQRFSEALQREYGIAPGAPVQALARRISDERVWNLPADAVTGEKPEVRSWPLVGRAHELQALLARWNECRTSRRPLVYAVLGDPGMGKSRLAEEVLSRARLDGAHTATTRAVPGDNETRWRGLAGLLVTEPAGLVAGPNRDIDPLRHLIESAAPADAPLAVLIDDAEWLDADSLHAVRAVLRDVADRSVFLLLCAGSVPTTALDTLLARIGRDIEGDIVRIGPLDSAAVGELVHDVVPELRAAEHDRLVRRVVADSAGVPFLASALLRAVTSGLDIHELQEAWPAPFRTLDHTLPAALPDAVIAAIRVEFWRLGTAAQQVLRAAAVCSEPIVTGPIAGALGLDDAQLARACDELEWERWLSSDPRGYTFRARLLRQVVAEEMMTPGQRRHLEASLTRVQPLQP